MKKRILNSLKPRIKSLMETTPYRILHKSNPAILNSTIEVPLRGRPSDWSSGLVLSLVVPAYNVEPYIEQFLVSIFSQSSDLRAFEVIVVDDGSTDGTADIVKHWKLRYPRHIRYIYQDNAGQADARNTGMSVAKGTWIGFPDPDDFLDVDYFKHMLAETKHKHGKPLLAISSALIFYFEEKNSFSDSHPLKYRFNSAVTRKTSDDLGDYMLLSAATSWFRRDAIVKHELRFDTRVIPAFEDAHFVNNLLLHAPAMSVSFISAAKYYYRKRSNQSSTLDGTKQSAGWFSDQLKAGVLDLLKSARSMRGFVPKYIQRTCLYDVFWRHRYLVNNCDRAGFLTPDQKENFLNLLEAIFTYIDIDTIENFNLAGCTEEHKVALLMLYKSARRTSPAIYVKQIHAAEGLAQFEWFSGGDEQPMLIPMVNGLPVAPVFSSRARSDFMGETYFYRNAIWLRLQDGDDVSFEQDGKKVSIRRSGNALGYRTSWLKLRNAIEPAAPTNLGAEDKRLRDYVLSARSKFSGCTVLMDKTTKADDNAEHLYRYMMATGRADHAWFVLSPESSDWVRLKREGFRLLPYGSDDHIAALMNAKTFLSSHLDHSVLWPVHRESFLDLARYKFVFLQHGVALHDMSNWFNQKSIAMCVASTPFEVQAFVAPTSKYHLSEREILLCGLPRHDALVRYAAAQSPNSIIFAPTWRQDLTLPPELPGGPRRRSDSFMDSEYKSNWEAVLNSERLIALANNHNLRIVLAQHPNMTMYNERMKLPDHIEILNPAEESRYQSILVSAKTLITDYSSVASEVAFLQRPVIYFQFDRDEMFAGSKHVVWKSGDFSYENDGFGPVAFEPETVVDRIEDALLGKEDPVYAARRHSAFPFRDGQCCERVCQAIERLNNPGVGRSATWVTEVAQLPSLPDNVAPITQVSADSGPIYPLYPDLAERVAS